MVVRKKKALPHLDEKGEAHMVDVGAKPSTHRIAIAEAFVNMKPETLDLLLQGGLQKGDALAVARIAGIAGSKRTADLVPLAHPIGLTHVSIDLSFDHEGSRVRVEARAETISPTGVELEAIVAAMSAALSIYDMAKSKDRAMVIDGVKLLFKTGGRSGTFGEDTRSKVVSKKRATKKPRTR